MLKKILHDLEFEHGVYVTDVNSIYLENNDKMWRIDNTKNIEIIKNVINLIKEEQFNTNDLVTKWTLGRILDKIYGEDYDF